MPELYATQAIATFSPLKLKAVCDVVIQRGLCRTTIKKQVGTIKRIFKWGTENELVPDVGYERLIECAR